MLIVIDGLDKVQDKKDEFIKGVHAFAEHLQEPTSKVKILLTSRPQDEIKEVLDRLPYIEYNKERKGWTSSLILLYLNSLYKRVSF